MYFFYFTSECTVCSNSLLFCICTFKSTVTVNIFTNVLLFLIHFEDTLCMCLNILLRQHLKCFCFDSSVKSINGAQSFIFCLSKFDNSIQQN